MLMSGYFSFFYFIGLLLYIPFCRTGDPCPPEEVLKSCTCKNEALATSGESPTTDRNLSDKKSGNDSELNNSHFFTTVKCNKSRSIIELQEDVNSGLYRKYIDKLTLRKIPTIRDHILASLPEYFMKYIRVNHLEILDSKLSGSFLWNHYPFTGQENSLTMLTLNHCSLFGALTYDVSGTINTKNLEFLYNLEMLDLSKNYLTFIHNSAFRKTYKNLSSIDLSFNGIENIEVSAFREVINLKTINLSHNCLRSLHRHIFHPSSMILLETVDFSWNFLEILPVDLFSNMPALKTVNLAKNFLRSLPEKPWSQIWLQLSFLDLNDNFINCNCELLWLVLQRNGTAAMTENSSVPNSSRTIRGKCLYHKLPENLSLEYQLNTLKKNEIMCL